MQNQGSIKIIPEQRQKPPKWVNYVLILLLSPLIGLGFLYFTLHGQVSSLEATKASITSQINFLETDQENVATEKYLVAVSRQLKDFSLIFEAHRESSKLFNFLRSVCHPQVQLDSLNVSFVDMTISINGRANDFRILGEQFLIFDSMEEVKDLTLSDVSLEKEGGVSFVMRFGFGNSLIKEINE